MEFPDERKTGSHEAAELALLRNDLSSVIPTNHRRGAGRASLFRDSRGGCLYMSICFSIAALIRILLNGYNCKFIGFSEEADMDSRRNLGAPEGSSLGLHVEHSGYAGGRHFDRHGRFLRSERQGGAEELDATPLTLPSPQADVEHLSQIAKQLEPSVVNINTESTIKNPHRRRGGQSRPTTMTTVAAGWTISSITSSAVPGGQGGPAAMARSASALWVPA